MLLQIPKRKGKGGAGGAGEKGDDLCKLMEEKLLRICYPKVYSSPGQKILK